MGKNRNGGYAELISVPSENVFLLPDDIPFEQGAIMMCSSATSYHALMKARLQEGESVAIFGVGGLGMAAIQLARSFGASIVYAIDLNDSKLMLAFTGSLVSASITFPLNTTNEVSEDCAYKTSTDIIKTIIIIFNLFISIYLDESNSTILNSTRLFFALNSQDVSIGFDSPNQSTFILLLATPLSRK